MIQLLLLLTALLPNPAGEKELFGDNKYGAVTLERIAGVGLVRLNGTTVSDSITVTGSLITNNAHLNHLEVLGEANLRDTTIDHGAVITGHLQAQKVTISTDIFITSQKAIFTQSKLKGITFRKDGAYKGKQFLELKQGTLVDGPITFEGGKGEIHLYSGSQILGPVKGAKIIRKN